jgi:YjbR
VTADHFRDIALSMNGAVEGAHMQHPDFRANGRIFASLSATEDTGTLKLSPEEQRELMRSHPEVFRPAAGAWGRQGWTLVELDAADTGSVRAGMLLAWQGVGRQPPKRTSSKRRAPSAASRRGKRRT